MKKLAKTILWKGLTLSRVLKDEFGKPPTYTTWSSGNHGEHQFAAKVQKHEGKYHAWFYKDGILLDSGIADSVIDALDLSVKCWIEYNEAELAEVKEFINGTI